MAAYRVVEHLDLIEAIFLLNWWGVARMNI